MNERLGKAIMALMQELAEKDELTPAEEEFVEAMGEALEEWTAKNLFK